MTCSRSLSPLKCHLVNLLSFGFRASVSNSAFKKASPMCFLVSSVGNPGYDQLIAQATWLSYYVLQLYPTMSIISLLNNYTHVQSKVVDDL